MDTSNNNSATWVGAIVGFVILAVGCLFLYWLISSAWAGFSQLDKGVAIAIISVSGTLLASTATVVIGRSIDRVKEREALHRDKKIQMYDEFLIRIFSLFANGASELDAKDKDDLVSFLRESQRKFMLWSSPGVIRSYAELQKALPAGNAQSIFRLEDFFSALRVDLGHSNRGLKRGDMIRFILRNTDLFLSEAGKNPNITMDELACLPGNEPRVMRVS